MKNKIKKVLKKDKELIWEKEFEKEKTKKNIKPKSKKIKLKTKKKKQMPEELEILGFNSKRKSKIKKFFTEPSFNLVEVIITLIIVCSLVSFVLIYIKNKEIDLNNNSPLNEITSVTDEKLLEFIDLYNDINQNYYANIDSDELLDKITQSMLEYLGDKYTGYIDKAESRELQDRLNGKYKGLGVEIVSTNDNQIVVKSIFKASPASKVDIQIGDIIKEVAGIDVSDKTASELSLLVKDSLSGIISVVIERSNIEKTVYIEKGEVIINAVSTEMFDDVGYLKINTFSTTSVNQVENALLYLESKKINSLIVDLRYNTGGYLTSAEKISNMFLEKGKIVYQLETKKGTEVYKDVSSTKRDYKVIVLINGSSASASEMFALALRDSYGASIVGAKSFGKGTVQQTTQLSTGSLVKFTVANWLSPKGESINQKGITPNIVADLSSAYLSNPTYENDGQLQAALKAIK